MYFFVAADLAVGQREGAAADHDHLAVRGRVLDLHALEAAVGAFSYEVVVAVLSVGEEDAVASTAKVGRHHQLREVAFSLQVCDARILSRNTDGEVSACVATSEAVATLMSTVSFTSGA